MKTLLRAAAVAVASTALVAGMTTSASAAPGDTGSASVQAQTTALPGFATSKTTLISTTTRLNTPDSDSAYGLKATVRVNGKPVANRIPVNTFFQYQRAWGAGVVTLTNFTLSGHDVRPGQPNYGYYTDQPIKGSSNAFRVRYGLEYRNGFQVRKSGKKLTFKVKLRYVNNRHKNVGIRKAKLQIKNGRKWKTVKNLKLKKNGTVKVKRSDKKKRIYRVTVKTTNTYQGGVYQTRSKI